MQHGQVTRSCARPWSILTSF
ncbi:hypothetical protein F383_27053 [Gossypium arboreum]|uniref:Uncharacterized protein n=1 Tax=Gossypium arboreum TaxID=29729 RepID=A0A0B0MMN4_GOSAR|nr:hypothetical protein F383_27053 [Gossypium arboreum]